MRIAICGQGKLGRPLLEVLGNHHQVIGHDSNPEKSQATVAECVEKSECCIFIVQTPSNPDGSFSNVHLLRALTEFSNEAKRQAKPDYTYIVTSTTVPGSCESFRNVVGDRIVYNPLFVRLEYVYEDLLNPKWMLFGYENHEALNTAMHVYFWTPRSIQNIGMSLTEAELAKITLNCALTMKISLANQLHIVASKMGCNPKNIMHAVGLDPRIGLDYLQPGWPYSGPCLPRDNRMFRFVAAKVGETAPLSLAADEINDRMYKLLAEKKS